MGLKGLQSEAARLKNSTEACRDCNVAGNFRQTLAKRVCLNSLTPEQAMTAYNGFVGACALSLEQYPPDTGHDLSYCGTINMRGEGDISEVIINLPGF